jgi:tetratricopeptide (TPR) repeat protein
MRYRILIIGLAAILLTGVGVLFGLHQGGSPNAATAQASSTLAPAGQAPADQLAGGIARAQERLRAVPGDYVTWAALGSAYIERARVTADPTYYPKAEGALRRSLELRSTGNPAALVGLGALANARHEFAAARDLARRALRIDPYSADAYGVLADAQTQLGNPPAATDAIQHMLDLRPGLAAYARASYDLEQQGRLGDAAALMRRALGDAVDPADIAFCRYQLGELAWRTGRLGDAETEYAGGQAADPAYLPLLAGQARVAAAHGHTAAALADYAELTARYPSPGYLMEYANLLRAAGQPTRANQQLALAAAALRLFKVNGGTDDLGVAQLAVAQGHSRQAVLAAEREWSRRHFADVADALGWALHQSGANAEAISYARKADALGARNSGYLFHLGMIELSLGRNGDARRDLSAALALNPHFSPLDAPVATAVLNRLGPR